MPKLGIRMPTMGMKTVTQTRKTAPVAVWQPAARQRATLASALFTVTQQRMLGLLFGQPGRSFFATELIGLTGSGSGAVQRELRRLAESGLVTVSAVGNQKHYQANRTAPIFAELCGIAAKILGPAETLRAFLAPLAKRLHAAWLYGSVAKASDRADSDIDLLVVADGLLLEDLYAALAPAEKKLGRPVHPTLYTLKEFRQRRLSKNPFLTKVLAGNPVPLFLNNNVIDATG